MISMRKANIASPKPMPKMKKAPIRSSNRMGTSRDDARGFVFAKHFSAPGIAFLTENWGIPASQSSISLHSIISKCKRIQSMLCCRNKSINEIQNVRNGKRRWVFAVLLQRQRPKSENVERICEFKTTLAILFEIVRDKTLANCFHLEMKIYSQPYTETNLFVKRTYEWKSEISCL